MKVRMLTLMAGPGGVYRQGAEVKVDRETGNALIAAKFAVPASEMEIATAPPAETTSMKKRQK